MNTGPVIFGFASGASMLVAILTAMTNDIYGACMYLGISIIFLITAIIG